MMDLDSFCAAAAACGPGEQARWALRLYEETVGRPLLPALLPEKCPESVA